MMHRNVVSTASSAQLLEDYRAGSSFFFASPERTLLADGVLLTLQAQEEGEQPAKGLPERVALLLQEAKQRPGQNAPIVVGAVPFDHLRPAQLVVPAAVHWAGPLDFAAISHREQPAHEYKVRPVPEPEGYMQAVEQGLSRIAAGEISKVVLSRTLQVELSGPADIQQLLGNLARSNTHGYTFAMHLPNGRTLIGASPELLVSRRGLQITVNPLAGSAARSADPAEDRRRAMELLASGKARHEHAVVIDAVHAALKPFCRKLDVPAGPELLSTAAMWHLSTLIRGELADAAVSSLELAMALHPTPAVCGAPTAPARKAIEEIEAFDRKFFTGVVGWCNSNGDGDWVITIRCAEASDSSLCLFAGAGIVAGSKPEEELAETGAKFRTMLHAMGLGNE